jgi:hypothetical protein
LTARERKSVIKIGVGTEELVDVGTNVLLGTEDVGRREDELEIATVEETGGNVGLGTTVFKGPNAKEIDLKVTSTLAGKIRAAKVIP